MSHREHDVVVLTRDVPEHGLRAGDVGAVVHVYADAKGYEVEFVTSSGETLAIEVFELKDLRALSAGEFLHSQRITAA